jgi:hypothetical protein
MASDSSQHGSLSTTGLVEEHGRTYHSFKDGRETIRLLLEKSRLLIIYIHIEYNLPNDEVGPISLLGHITTHTHI